MSTRSREITFIVKMRNQARQAIQGLSGDLRKAAKEAGTAAAGIRATVGSADQLTVSANQAAAAVSKLNRATGGAVDPLNRKKKAVRGLWQEIKTAAKQMVIFSAMAALIAAPALLGGAVLEMAADYRALASRILMVADTQQQANAVMGEVYDIAQRTRSAIEGVGTLYYRSRAAVRDFGYSQRDVLKMTELVSQAMVVSGARTEEAKGAMIQFSQALASNRLGGEELNSVKEQAPRLVKALIDGMNQTAPQLAQTYGQVIEKTVGGTVTRIRKLTIGSLKKMAEDGALTTSVVMDALLNQADEVAAEFGKYPLLARDAANVAKNAIQKEFAEIDMMTGLNDGFAKFLIMLGNDVIPLLSDAIAPIFDTFGAILSVITTITDVVGGVLKALGVDIGLLVRAITSFATVGGLAYAAWVGFPLLMGLLSKGFLAAANGMKALTVAMLANPFTFIFTVVTALIALFVTFKDVSFKLGGETVSMAGLMGEAWARYEALVGKVFAFVGSIWDTVTGKGKKNNDQTSFSFKKLGSDIVKAMGSAFKFLITASIFASKAALVPWKHWKNALLEMAVDAMNGFLKATEWGVNKVVGFLNDTFKLNISPVDVKEMANQYRGAVKVLGSELKTIAKESVAEGEEYIDGFLKGAAKRTRRDALKADQIAGANLEEGNGNRLVPDPEKDKDAEKKAEDAAKERLKRIKELASAIQSLANDYAPWLEISMKDIEAQEQLADLNAARARSADEFSEALKRANMTLEEYAQLAYAVSNNLRADEVKDFFKEYMTGWEGVEKAQERAADGRVVANLLAAQAKGAEEYEKYLRLLGITALQADEAIRRFQQGLDKTSYDQMTDSLKGFIETHAPYAAALNAEAAKQLELAELERLRLTNLGEFEAMLARLGYTMGDYEEAVRAADIAQKAQSDGWYAAQQAAKEYIDDIKLNGMKTSDVWGNAFRNMEDALAEFVATGKMDFKSLVDSMIRDIARLIAQKIALKMVESAMNFFMPGSGTAMSAAASSHMSVPTFPVGHSGGIVSLAGQASKAGRRLNPSHFAGARRYHVGGIVGSGGGLRPNEVPVIAKQNEAIMPTTRMSDGNLGVKAILPDGWGGAGAGGAEGQSGAKVVSMTIAAGAITISVQGGENNEETGQVVSSALRNALVGLVQETLVDEKRPGGILNQ